MKKNKSTFLLARRAWALPAVLLGIGVAPSPSVKAASQTWDGAASNIWNTSALNWGGAAFTSGNDALFTGTPTNNVATATGLTIGTITLDSSFTGSVTMSGANTVNGATAINGGTLNLNAAAGLGASAVTVNSGGTLAINPGTGASTVTNSISGGGILNTTLPTVANSLTLSGNLSGFTGTLNVGIGSGGGKLALSNATNGQQISSSATINVATNGTLYVASALNYGSSLFLNGGTTGEALGQLRIEGGATWTGGITLKANTTIGANTGGTGTISGAIGESGGSFGFTKVGAGTTVLSTANTYTGGTTISAGTLSVGNNSALSSGTVTFNGGTLANTTGVTLANAFTTTGVGTITASGGTMAINGNVTGGQGLTLNPTNKITLAGTNSFGTSASFGNLTVNTGAGGVDITGSTTVGNGNSATFGGYLNVTGNVTTTVQSGGSLSILGTTNASNHPNSGIGGTNATTSTLVVNGGSFTVGAATGFIIGNGSTGTGVLTISSGTATINAGTTTDNGADTRFIAMGRDNAGATGTINLNGGILATSRAFARDTSSAAGSGTANFVFGGGTLRALANQTDWLASTTSAINANALALSSVTTTAVSTIDSNGFAVGVNNAISGAGGFNIASTSGSGTVTLGGTNTFTGVTKVNSGTLALGNVNALQNSPLDVTGAGAVTFTVTANGGVNTYNLGGLKNSAGTGTVGTTLAAGANSITLGSSAVSAITIANIADFNGAAAIAVTSGAFTLGGTLNVTFANTFANDSSAAFNLFDGNTAGTLTTVSILGSYTATLNSGNSYHFTDLGGNTFDFNNTSGVLSFTAVPEPHEFAVAIAALLGVVVFIRRRARQA